MLINCLKVFLLDVRPGGKPYIFKESLYKRKGEEGHLA
jgi:hypothetical protein